MDTLSQYLCLCCGEESSVLVKQDIERISYSVKFKQFFTIESFKV